MRHMPRYRQPAWRRCMPLNCLLVETCYISQSPMSTRRGCTAGPCGFTFTWSTKPTRAQEMTPGLPGRRAADPGIALCDNKSRPPGFRRSHCSFRWFNSFPTSCPCTPDRLGEFIQSYQNHHVRCDSKSAHDFVIISAPRLNHEVFAINSAQFTALFEATSVEWWVQ